MRVLDGLRGIAAMAVVLYHFGMRAELWLMPHGYLAVDFFFTLSGFVLTHAYYERLHSGMLSARAFMRLRLIRLLPMLLPAALLGAFVESARLGHPSLLGRVAQIVIATMLGSLAIPLPISTFMEQTIFPINGPVWSLFFELFASALFFVVMRAAQPGRVSWALVSAGAVIMAAFGAATGTIDVGYWLGNWPVGFPRVTLDFFLGVVGYRWHGVPRLRSFTYPLVLVLVLMVPYLGSGLDAWLSVASAVLIFPLLIASASYVQPRQALTESACTVLAEISYPLYALHYPVVKAICFELVQHKTGAGSRLAACGLTLAALSGLSWVAFRLYDFPVRRAMSRRFRPERPIAAQI